MQVTKAFLFGEKEIGTGIGVVTVFFHGKADKNFCIILAPNA